MFSDIKMRQNHRALASYRNNHYTNIIKYAYKDDIKFKTQSREKSQKTQEGKTLVFQKNQYKVQHKVQYKVQYKPFEENSDHTRITHKIQFRSSLKKRKKLAKILYKNPSDYAKNALFIQTNKFIEIFLQAKSKDIAKINRFLNTRRIPTYRLFLLKVNSHLILN